jgi:hypothetical protein
MIYLARNLKNGKVYIGQTLKLGRRKTAHKVRASRGGVGLFYDAIREHGFDAFECQSCPPRQARTR